MNFCKTVSGRVLPVEYILLLRGNTGYLYGLINALKLAVYLPFLDKEGSFFLKMVRTASFMVAFALISLVVIKPSLVWITLAFGLPALILSILCYYYETGMKKRLTFIYGFALPMLLIVLPLIIFILTFSDTKRIKNDDVSIHGLDVRSRSRFGDH